MHSTGRPLDVTSEQAGYLDGVILDSVTELPIESAQITVDGLPDAVLTDASGRFSYPVSQSNRYGIRITHAGYIQAQRRVRGIRGRDVGLGRIYLKREDPQATAIRADRRLVRDSRGRIEVLFPRYAAMSLREPLEVRATWYERERELPGPLPESSQFTYAMDLAPDGAQFQEPVTVRFKNTRGFPSGMTLPVGVYDRLRYAWIHEATARVSEDGEWVNFEVTHFSPRDINIPPPPAPGLPLGAHGESHERLNICTGLGSDIGNSAVDYLTGELREKIPLVSYKVLGQDRGLMMTYASQQVNPWAWVRVIKPKTSNTLEPDRIRVKIRLEGQEQELFLEGTQGAFAIGLMLRKENARGKSLATGLHYWQGEVIHEYEKLNFYGAETFAGPSQTDTGISMNAGEVASYPIRFEAPLLVMNSIESPYGAGWQLEGLSKLYEDPLGRGMMIVEGEHATYLQPQYELYASLVNASGTNGLVKVLDPVGEGEKSSFPIAGANLMMMNPDGTKLHVGSRDGKDLHIVDIRSGQVAGTLDLARGQEAMTLSPDGTRLYVSGYYRISGSQWKSCVYVIDTEHNQLAARFSTMQLSRFMALNETGTKLYCSENASGYSYIEIFSTANFNRLAMIAPGPVTGASSFVGLAMAWIPGENKIYCLSQTSTGEGHLLIVDGGTDAVTKVIATDIASRAIEVTGDGTRAVVAHPTRTTTQGYLTILETAGDHVLGRIPLGMACDPHKLLISRDDQRAYSADLDHKTVSVVDLGKQELLTQIPLDAKPESLALTGDDGALWILAYRNRSVEAIQIDARQLLKTKAIQLHPDGTIGQILASSENGKLVAKDGSELIRQADGTYRRTYSDGRYDAYDADGDLAARADTHGNIFQYEYEITPLGKRLARITDPIGSYTQLDYDEEGKLRIIEDPQGRRTHIMIDDAGDLIELAYPDGAVYEFRYDGEHRLIQKRNPRGAMTDYRYGVYGQIEEVESATNEVRRYQPGILDGLVNEMAGVLEGETISGTGYDSRGLKAEKIDGLGRLWTHWVNAQGQVVEEQDPLGRRTQSDYTSRGYLAGMTRPNGSRWTRTYDRKGNLLTHTEDAIEAKTGFTYEDKFNKPVSITDAKGHETTFEYDLVTGDLVKIKDALGQLWNLTYTSRGLVESITNPQGDAVGYHYDAQGNLAAREDPLGHIWTFNRDDAGNLTGVLDPMGHETVYGYDVMNRLIAITDAEGGITQIGHQDSGCHECGTSSDLITSITDPNGNTWSFAYDEIGELVTVTDPLGNITQRSYDWNRNLISLTDALGHVTSYGYNEAGQLTEIINADGGRIHYSYNDLGRISTLADPNGNVTNFGYDAVGRLISETDPLGRETGYSYDKVHNLTKKITANGHEIRYSYDALNRLTGRTTPEQMYVFEYDSLSRLTAASNASSLLNFSYDSAGQLLGTLTTQDSRPTTVSYSYDAAGRRMTRTDPTGVTRYGYDKAGRLTSITDRAQNNFSIMYDKAGRRTSLTCPGGLERTYRYDSANRLIGLINKVNGVQVAPFSYEYDRAGNRMKLTDAYGEHSATYDAVYRLLSLTNSVITNPQGEVISLNESFSYDLTGNRLTQTKPDGSIVAYSHNELNQMTAGTNGLSLSYDANGNVVSKTEDDITWTYTWNSENQLTQAASSDGQYSVFEYDTLGRKISEASNGITTSWVYDGYDILLEHQNGLPTNRYTHGPWIDEPLEITDLVASRNYYYHSDALGSIAAITDGTGSVVESYRHSSYGVPIIYDDDGLEIGGSSIGNRYLFAGREYDQETSLCHYLYRERDPNIGNFLSKDPLGSDGGLNLYSYTSNNPINWIDRWGLKTEVGFEEPQGFNPFGHSFIKIDQYVYDFGKYGKEKQGEVRRRSEEDLFADERGQQLSEVPLSRRQEDILRKRLEESVGKNYRYDKMRNNCADFVEDRLRGVGVDFPEDGIEFPRDTLKQVDVYRNKMKGKWK